MFLQAEFQIFKQMDFDLIIPTGLDFLLSVLFLEDVKIQDSMSLDIIM